jgi:hypothetical protein
MNRAKTSFSTEICDGAIISVVQYFAPLRYIAWGSFPFTCSPHPQGYLTWKVQHYAANVVLQMVKRLRISMICWICSIEVLFCLLALTLLVAILRRYCVGLDGYDTWS